jgi:hypothetical protein
MLIGSTDKKIAVSIFFFEITAEIPVADKAFFISFVLMQIG